MPLCYGQYLSVSVWCARAPWHKKGLFSVCNNLEEKGCPQNVTSALTYAEQVEILFPRQLRVLRLERKWDYILKSYKCCCSAAEHTDYTKVAGKKLSLMPSYGRYN